MGFWARFLGRELPERVQPPDREIAGGQRDGKKHGLWIEKGQEGWQTGWLECVYRDGVRHGPFRFWHPAGFVYERGSFVEGAKDGEVEFRGKDGRRFATAMQRAGKWHGPYREYAEDGSIVLEREYRDGTIYAGRDDLKSSSGDHHIWRRTYRDGHPVGAWEEFDHAGRPKLRAAYDDDGRLDGAWSDHHADGAVRLEGRYAHGARAGTWQWRRQDGSIVASCDHDGDRVWRADGIALGALDDVDLDRWIGLADAWARVDVQPGWYHLEKAIDAWPEGNREVAVAWVEARLGERGGRGVTVSGGGNGWLGVLLQQDHDPRVRLVAGICTDHDEWREEHVARLRRRAGGIRELALYECFVVPGIASLFPEGVAWPLLETLSIQECGPLGSLVRTLASASWTAALRVLRLEDDEHGLSADEVAALLRSPHLSALRVLWLSNPLGGDALVRAIAEAPLLECIEDLTIRDASDSVAVAEALAARTTPALQSLELRGEGKLSRQTVVGLVARARHPALERLQLEDFDLPRGIAAELQRGWPSVRFSAR